MRTDGDSSAYWHDIYWRFHRTILLILITVLSMSPVLYLNQTASAAQITNRSLTISSAVPNQTNVTYTFSFEPVSANTIQSMYFESCTTAVGACTSPSGLDLQTGTVALTSGFNGVITGLTQNASNSSPACDVTANLCANWNDATAQTPGQVHIINVSGVINQSQTTCSNNWNCTFFIRMFTYSDTAYTNSEDYGTVASATTQTFTVNATVEEQLSFCVGSVTGDSATVETISYAMPNCTTLSGTSLSLGTLGTGETTISPVAAGQPLNGDNNNGVVELNTNASNGTAIYYNAIQQSGTNHLGSLRVAGANCSAGNTFTDQCINSIGPSAAFITPGTENFGMTGTGINCYNVPAGVYTCNGSTHNLVLESNYECNAVDASNSYSSFDAGGQIAVQSTCKYAWDENANNDLFASSPTVVAGEAATVEFAATPEITTPTGSYTALVSFVAVPEY